MYYITLDSTKRYQYRSSINGNRHKTSSNHDTAPESRQTTSSSTSTDSEDKSTAKGGAKLSEKHKSDQKLKSSALRRKIKDF